MWQYQNTDELYHHGVLGMKWGIRRYQNKDGSYTSAGKQKYLKDKTKAINNDINSISKAGAKKSGLGKDQNSVINALKKVRQKQEEKYSKKWDKKVDKEENKIASKIDKHVNKSKGSTKQVYAKINNELKSNKDILEYQKTVKSLQNKKTITIDEVVKQNKLADKAETARINIILKYQNEMTQAALKDLGYEPSKASAERYKKILQGRYSR